MGYAPVFFFFFNDTATTEIYTLSLHDALPISDPALPATARRSCRGAAALGRARGFQMERDRKSTRLNSSHGYISYAVFCLKKKILTRPTPQRRLLRKCGPSFGQGDPEFSYNLL